MNDKLNQATFTAAMEKAVEMRGRDYIYPKSQPGWQTVDPLNPAHPPACVYSTDEGEPACLIGLALHLIDPKLCPTYEASCSNLDMDAQSVLMRLLSGDPYAYTPQWVRAALDAQGVQDTGGSWGTALDRYLSRAEEGV